MKAFDTNPNLRWLFCFTHPDDEMSICAWIRRLVQNGNDVYLSWSHSTFVREHESRAVAMILGIPQSRLFFHKGTDGRIAEEMPELVRSYQRMMQDVRPDRVCCLSFEQGHIDHDATNFLVSQTFAGPICEVPIYHTYASKILAVNKFASPEGQEVLHLTRDERKLKLFVAKQFPSQKIWPAVRLYRALNTARLRPNHGVGTERMRVQKDLNYLKPNLPPKLAGRVRKTATWLRWKRAIRSYRRIAEEQPAERESVLA
jgi:LmbE family N-acetylglucosaminyl deacetylase